MILETIHLLPTEKESQIHRNKVKDKNGIRYVTSFVETPSKCPSDGLFSGNQHLYVTINEEIKPGEWYLVDNIRTQEIRRATEHTKGIKPKVIKTSEPSLMLEDEIDAYYRNGIGGARKVKQLSQEFIKSYCHPETTVQSDDPTNEIPDKEIFKKVAVEFFYHWWNTAGSNTLHGFDEWWEDKGKDLVKNSPAITNTKS